MDAASRERVGGTPRKLVDDTSLLGSHYATFVSAPSLTLLPGSLTLDLHAREFLLFLDARKKERKKERTKKKKDRGRQRQREAGLGRERRETREDKRAHLGMLLRWHVGLEVLTVQAAQKRGGGRKNTRASPEKEKRRKKRRRAEEEGRGGETRTQNPTGALSTKSIKKYSPRTRQLSPRNHQSNDRSSCPKTSRKQHPKKGKTLKNRG